MVHVQYMYPGTSNAFSLKCFHPSTKVWNWQYCFTTTYNLGLIITMQLWWAQPIQISQNSPPTITIRNECVTRMHSMGVLMSGRGLWDYYDPRVCVVWLLRQCRLRFDVTHVPPIQSTIEALRKTRTKLTTSGTMHLRTQTVCYTCKYMYNKLDCAMIFSAFALCEHEVDASANVSG